MIDKNDFQNNNFYFNHVTINSIHLKKFSQ